MEQQVGSEAAPQDLRLTVDRLTVDRLMAATALLEHAVEELRAKPLTQLSAEAEASIERIVASAEAKREAELERKLEFVEAQLEAMRASRVVTVEAAGREASGRKTLPSGMLHLLAKQGVTAESIEAGAQDGSVHGGLDRALCSLSIEQRIAVKSELLRAGLIG